uniref:Acidic leucine-rich nuclear phosphoprotein 32-related protein 2-like n=1 Tax=Steinernema glaseri TaxID=37863 RepID=A0A1I8ARU3_9BILA
MMYNYDYFPLGPAVNDDESDDDLWSIWSFDDDELLRMWLLAWGDRYEELLSPAEEDTVEDVEEDTLHIQSSPLPVEAPQKKKKKSHRKRLRRIFQILRFWNR